MTTSDILRIVHIIFGIYLAGSYLFIVPILEPRLRRLGAAIHGPVMSALMPILTPINGASFVIVVGTGVALALSSRAFNSLFATAWGWTIIVGLVATLAAIVVGFGLLTPRGIRMDKLGRSVRGRAPTPQEGRQLQELSAQVETLSRVNLVLVVIALGTMVAARYV
ncbi:MAG: hypothetical protein HY670_04910 [Chloroflexi bacterium]|nr:hypothetical protein [Chloroflexota bacterium]